MHASGLRKATARNESALGAPCNQTRLPHTLVAEQHDLAPLERRRGEVGGDGRSRRHGSVCGVKGGRRRGELEE